jgi:hypothetical protein
MKLTRINGHNYYLRGENEEFPYSYGYQNLIYLSRLMTIVNNLSFIMKLACDVI